MLRFLQVTLLLMLIVTFLSHQTECQITIERTIDKDVIKGVDCSAVHLDKTSPGNCECSNERPFYYFRKQITQQPCYNENELETEIGRNTIVICFKIYYIIVNEFYEDIGNILRKVIPLLVFLVLEDYFSIKIFIGVNKM